MLQWDRQRDPIHVEAEIPIRQRDGLGRAMMQIVVGVYNAQDFLFNLNELRRLDTWPATACLDCLNYGRLRTTEVHKHLANGDRDLHRWLEQYGIEPAPHS
jgi:hypothetical protein